MRGNGVGLTRLACLFLLALLAAAPPARAQGRKLTLSFTDDLLYQIATDNLGERTADITARIQGLSQGFSAVRLSRAGGKVALGLTAVIDTGLELPLTFSLDKTAYYRMSTARTDVAGMAAILQQAKAAEPLILEIDYRYDARYAIIDLTVDARRAMRTHAEARPPEPRPGEEVPARLQAQEESPLPRGQVADDIARAVEEARAAAAAARAAADEKVATQAKAARDVRIAAARKAAPAGEAAPPPPVARAAAAGGYLSVRRLGREAPPLIDGRLSDPAWLMAQRHGFEVRGASGNLAVSIWGLWTPGRIWLLVRWPDATRDDIQRPWVWSPEAGRYTAGEDVEDALSLAFAREGHLGDCMLGGTESTSDLWTWRAARTNPTGFAEDGTLRLALQPIAHANSYQTRNGKTVWVQVIPDQGTPPSQPAPAPEGYAGGRTPSFLARRPGGSAADVVAAGSWNDGSWTVEFSRALDTGDPDDAIFAEGPLIPFSAALFDHREGFDHSNSSALVLRLE